MECFSRFWYQVSINTCNFFKFFESLWSFFFIFAEPLSWGIFSKNSWYAVAVSRVNGMVINCSWLPLQQILIKFDVIFFSNFLANCYHVPSLWIFMSQWNLLKLEIGILGNLLIQWNGFEDFNILNFSRTL